MNMFLIGYVVGILAFVFLYALFMDEIWKLGDFMAIGVGVSIFIWPLIVPLYTAFLLGYYAREWLNKRSSK